jgi:hypothetical protein
MNIFIEKLKKDVGKELNKIVRTEVDIIQRSLKSAHALDDSLQQLKAFTLPYTFKDQSEEICFFKETKPWFAHQYIYHMRVYDIEIKSPQGSVSDQLTYFRQHMQAIDNANAQIPDFLAYFRSASTSFDDKYFLRNQNEFILYMQPFSYELDRAFSTGYDYLVSTLMANDLLLSYLKMKEESLEMPKSPFAENPGVRLTWLGTKTALTELIYGLYYSKIFGDATLMNITMYFEKVFNTKLDNNMSRTLCEMRTRNHPVSFLHELAKTLMEHMLHGKKAETKVKTKQR